MEVKANYILVGIFTIAAIVAGFFTVFFISYTGITGNVQELDVYIHGAVTGLGKSSQVLFNGIRVGTVKDLMLDKKDPNLVIVQTFVNSSTPITASTQASLGAQGLTGYAFIDLKGGSLKEESLLHLAKKNGTIASIYADASGLNNLMNSAQDIAGQASLVTKQVGNLVTGINQPLQDTIKNIQTISTILGKNTQNIQDILKQTNLLLAKLNFISLHANDIVTKLDHELDGKSTNSLIAETKRTLLAVQNTATSINRTVSPLSSLGGLKKGSETSLSDLMFLLNQSQRAIGRIESTIHDFERNPSRVLWGGQGNVPRYNAGQ